MKKLLASILALSMIICVFALPCSAAFVADFNVNVDFDLETKVISLAGNVSSAYGSRDITYYLLNPGKTQDDIANAPVVAHYGQAKADKTSGAFSDSFRYKGDAGVYTLMVQSGNVIKAISVDTSNDISSDDSFQLSELYKLDESLLDPETGSYKTITTTDTRESFFAHRSELPDEMPVVSPREVEGLYTIYVDVNNGDDSLATGSIDAPYKTIKAALAANIPEGGMVLCLREGNYSANDAVNLKNIKASEENPFFITSYEGEEVNIVGGTPVNSQQFTNVTDADVLQRLNPAVAGEVLVADLKAMGVTSYGNITTSSSPVLFVGDSQYTLARWPNVELTGMMHVKDALGEEMAAIYEDLPAGYTQARGTGVIDCGYITIGVGSPCGNYRQYSKRATALNEAAGKVVSKDQGVEFCVEDIHPFSWVNTGDIWMYVSFHDEWTHNHAKVTEFNPETRSVRTETGINWGAQYKDCNKLYYYNILEELDSPGEWFMDKNAGKLYIYPAGDISKENILYASSDKTMWKLTDCENVIIEGINFEHARGAALEIAGNNTKNVVVQNCSFESVGSGVSFEGKHSGVINSEFTGILGGKAIGLNGGSSADEVALIPARQFAQNNRVYNSKGISTTGVGNIVSHNYLSNVIGSCLYFSRSRETVLEYNEVVAGPRETLDSGAIYLNGNQQFNRGNHVRYNYIKDTGTSIGSSIPQSIYFDDMASENYAYGNFVVGGRMLLHNGSENAIYNNILLDVPSGYQPINNSVNYYNQSISTSASPSPRWRTGALEYGTFTASLAPGNAYNDGNGNITSAYKNRYPLLQRWATYMYERIDEFNTMKGSMSAIRAAQSKTGSEITTLSQTGENIIELFGVQNESTTSTKYLNADLNSYLAASRENVYENNVFINVPESDKILQYGMIKGDGIAGEGKGHYDRKWSWSDFKYIETWVWDVSPVTEAGHVSPYTANNPIVKTNPFTNGNYNDASVYESLGVEAIPFDKIGLTNKENYPANEKTEAISPIYSTEATVVPGNVSLKWKAVEGAQIYKVQLATDSNFSNIIEEKSSFEMAYQVSQKLDNDTFYYWRVITMPIGNDGKGNEAESKTSDTFIFKTLPATATADNFNKFGVTDYVLEDADGNILEAIPENGEFKVSGYAYNLSGEDKDAVIYIACYDAKGALITVKSCVVDAVGDPGLTIYKESSSLTDSGRDADGAFSAKFTSEKFVVPGVANIKLFVWSNDGKMVPYSFVKEIK